MASCETTLQSIASDLNSFVTEAQGQPASVWMEAAYNYLVNIRSQVVEQGHSVEEIPAHPNCE